MNMDSGKIRLIFCYLVIDSVLTCILIPAASVEEEQFPILLVTLRRPQAWVPPFAEMLSFWDIGLELFHLFSGEHDPYMAGSLDVAGGFHEGVPAGEDL